jgi:hypothetical protein
MYFPGNTDASFPIRAWWDGVVDSLDCMIGCTRSEFKKGGLCSMQDNKRFGLSLIFYSLVPTSEKDAGKTW